MGAWPFGRAAGLTTGLVVAALATWALSAAAQHPPAPPAPFPLAPAAPPEPTPAGNESLPKLKLPGEENQPDPEVQPAQATRPVPRPSVPAKTPPASGSPATSPPAAPARPVPDPPAPTVRIQVRVPADTPPGDDLKYTITVQNTSQADAHRVVVRNPLSDAIEKVMKAEPPQDAKQSTEKQLVWTFGTLKPGEKKSIDLVLKPKPDAKEVKNLAYVGFEHGEAVTTRVQKPALKLTKAAPKEAIKGEPVTVRVVVENTSKVPTQGVRVVENVERSADVEVVTAGGNRTKPEDNQWEWAVGTLLPGQRKVIEYRMTPKLARDAFTTTNVSADKGVLEKAEARTVVLTPGLSVKLTGPTGVVNAGEPARYEITVRNTGTLPSTNIRITGTIPADCKPTTKTEGGQVYRDTIVWTVPRLEPGDARSFRFGVKASTTGRRMVVASATDARKVRASEELATLFQGVAALVWETTPDPAALAVGRQGTFTVRVKNNGGEEARNVRVEVELPQEVLLRQSTPDVRPSGGVLRYGPATVPAYGEAVFTITYEAKQSAQAWFKVKMTADALGDRPMQTEKAVEITGTAR